MLQNPLPDHDVSLQGAPDGLSGLSRRSSLYGRSRETQALSMAFRRAAAGGADLVVLSGPAGIGKTTLVRKMRAPLGQQSGYFISG
ncbi:MAG TPA: ATP-binding protein, partial [Pirellulaceae bacterium]|nr:ATP-binding protein [Pirellulaceae bacterium]